MHRARDETATGLPGGDEAVAAAVGAEVMAGGDALHRLVEVRLDNGARILVMPTTESAAGAGVAAVQLWVLSGTADERPTEHGCAHLLEHLLFKPSRLPSGQTLDITATVEALGGDINAFTSLDETVVHATVLAESVVDAVDALVGPVLHPRLDGEELASEIEVVVEEIRQDRDDPSARAHLDVAQRLFPGHGYGRPVLGRVGEVRAHDARRLRAFHRRQYVGRRLVLIVAGPVDPEPVIAAGRRWLEARPTGTPLRRRPAVEVRTRPAIVVRRRDVHEAQILCGWVAPPLPTADACALEVAAMVAGYGDSSRLMRRLRRGERLVADIHATMYGYRNASTWLVGAHTSADRVPATVEGIADEVRRMVRIGIDDEELARAKAVLVRERIYRAETAAGRAHAAGYFSSLGGGPGTEAQYFETLRGVGIDEVRRACRRWIDPRAMVLSVVVPKAEVDAGTTKAWRAQWTRALRRSPRGPRPKVIRRAGIEAATHGSGLRIRLARDPRVPVAAGWLMWPGGQRLETPRTSGTGPMLAKLLTRGCAALGPDALAREIEGRAAVLDGFSGRSSMGIHFECVAADVEHVLTRGLQCIVAPTFDEAELDEQRAVTLQTLLAEDDDLGTVAVRVAMRELYGAHPYAMRRRGDPTSLRRVTPASLRRRWRRNFPMSGAVLGVAGDVEMATILDRIDAVIGDARGEPVAGRWPRRAPPRVRRPRRIDVAQGRQRVQAHVVMAFAGLDHRDARGPALDVLMTVLGGQVGRLFTALRETEGLVYHVSASATEGVDAGDVLVYAATARSKVARTLAAIERELARMRETTIEAGELAHAKAVLAGEFAADFERRARVASALAFDELFGLVPFDRYLGRIERVSARTVRDLAAELLDPERAITVVAGG